MTAFLTAEWRRLLMLNFAVHPALLRPFVPPGTELDSWNGRTYASLVGFLFLRTKVLGVPVPFHSRFEEVNLRFYVKRDSLEGPRRGVVFIKEVVPKRAVAYLARRLYGEPYVALRTDHFDGPAPGSDRQGRAIEYRWQTGERWNTMRAVVTAPPSVFAPGSEEEFIAEHHWGYTALPHGRCREYRVDHEPWRVSRADSAGLDCDAAALYGHRFAESLGSVPTSAFLAEGSPVTLHLGRVC